MREAVNELRLLSSNKVLRRKYFIGVIGISQDIMKELEFLRCLSIVSRTNPVHIVYEQGDREYFDRISYASRKFTNFYFHFISSSEPPAAGELIRSLFLSTDRQYLVGIQTGIYIPTGLLNKFDRAINFLDKTDPDWGVLGSLYHRSQQSNNNSWLPKNQNVLKGGTLYKRAIIARFPFDIRQGDHGDYPDIWFNSSITDEFSFYDGHRRDVQESRNDKILPEIVKIYR